MSPYCPQCGVDNPPTARFCDQCGAMLIPVTGQQPAAPAATVVTPPPGPVASLAVGPTVCPQCGTAAIPGEAFCDNCGAPLAAPTPSQPAVQPPPSYGAGVPPQPSYPPPQPATSAPATPPPVTSVAPPPAIPAPVVPPPVAPVALRATLAPAQLVVAASGATLPLPAATQAIVGRGDPVSNFYPEIDLTPHGALDQGVGRRHLRLAVQGGQIIAEDLDSTNGTLINGQRLAARQPRPLRDGDQIQLGKLLLRFIEG